MLGYIDNYNFKEMEPMKYWAPPSSWSDEKKKETTQLRIFSGEWLAAEKKDGYFAKFVKDEDGNMMLFSRSRNVNGEFPDKIDWVPHLKEFFNSLPNGTCLLGELYLPSKPGSSNITTLLGCLKDKCISRQENSEKLHFYIFDILANNSKNWIAKPAIQRFFELEKLQSQYKSPYVEFAKYYVGKELWSKLQMILGNGGEGMVIIRDNSIYQPGKRPSKDCQKVKKELQENVDCIIVGANPPTKEYTGSKSIETWNYWINNTTEKKMEGQFYSQYYAGEPITPITKMYFLGGAGSLVLGVYKDEKVIPIGNLSGLTEDILLNWKQYIGKVCEVTAMEILPTGGLRHPKFVRFRDDKPRQDCTYESIYGKINE